MFESAPKGSARADPERLGDVGGPQPRCHPSSGGRGFSPKLKAIENGLLPRNRVLAWRGPVREKAYVSSVHGECGTASCRGAIHGRVDGTGCQGISFAHAASLGKAPPTKFGPRNQTKGAVIMATATSKPGNPKVVPPAEWLAARKELLKKEKEFTRLRDELSRQRRELPWEKVEKGYVFDGPKGKQTLADLFGGRSQLAVYHFMLGPGWKEGCPSCSFISD